ADIASDHFVDFVDFDGAHEQRLAAFDVGGKTVRVRPTGEIRDPAVRIDQNQWRSFFSRSPLRLVPRAIPRQARIGRSGTRKITPPLSRTGIPIPGRSWRRSPGPRGRTS